MRRLPKLLAVVSLSSGCSPAMGPPDAGPTDAGMTSPDAGPFDGGFTDAGQHDAGQHDAGPQDAGSDPCPLPSDFPRDAGIFVEFVCECADISVAHCPEEGGPRCSSWYCFPEKTADGGYDWLPGDAGVSCLC